MLILCCAEISYALFLCFRLARLFQFSSVLNCANLKINEVWKKQYNILNPRSIDTQKGATFCQVSRKWISRIRRAVHCWWLTKGLKRRDRLVHLLNDGQGGTCHRTYTCHTARSTATTTTTRRCDSMTFCARASFETFLASSRITQCAKKRLLCQGQRQDSPQVARASDASRTMGAKLSSSATRQLDLGTVQCTVRYVRLNWSI